MWGGRRPCEEGSYAGRKEAVRGGRKLWGGHHCSAAPRALHGPGDDGMKPPRRTRGKSYLPGPRRRGCMATPRRLPAGWLPGSSPGMISGGHPWSAGLLQSPHASASGLFFTYLESAGRHGRQEVGSESARSQPTAPFLHGATPQTPEGPYSTHPVSPARAGVPVSAPFLLTWLDQSVVVSLNSQVPVFWFERIQNAFVT